MDHYQEITLLPDPEFSAPILMNALYSKLHKALCDFGSTNIGVSFPDAGKTLGKQMRLHGDAAALRKIAAADWIGAMSGYCVQGEITAIPIHVKHRTVSRRQPTMSAAKLRRLAYRGSITATEFDGYMSKAVQRQGQMRQQLPYVELVSGSTGQRHRRFIEQGPLQEEPTEGGFDQFGLSKVATVPWF